jgi:gliding motility-associated-like protein
MKLFPKVVVLSITNMVTIKRRYLLASLFLALSFLANAQPGKLGNSTITGLNTVVNAYDVLAANVATGSTAIAVSNISNLFSGTALGAGDLVMIYQAQGATIQTTDDNNYGTILSYNGAGLYEFAYVSSVAGNTISLACTLRNSYTVVGKTQVIRVPLYNNLIVNAGASIVPQAWNGTTGGIVVLNVVGVLTNNGLIQANSFGFRGGIRDNLTSAAGAGIVTLYRSPIPNDGGEKGESIAGFNTEYDGAGMGGRFGRGAPANGGGGGNGHNAAGGGGSNGNNGLTWTGAGVMDPNPLFLAAWQLDPDFVSNGNALTNSSGGGRGGYTFAQSDQNALTTPLSTAVWTGDYRDPVGGRGGRPLNADSERRIYFGGGGGAGDGNNNASNNGGVGGGIVYVVSRTISGTGQIRADGQNGLNTVPGHNDAPGGGGGGGSIVIKSFSFTGQLLSANGGAGGSQLITSNESEGCGGGGGGGFIAIPTSGVGVCGVSNSYNYISGANGISTSGAITEFPLNGGTYGAEGQINIPVSPSFLPYSLTCFVDVDADAVQDPQIDLDDDNDGITDVEEGYLGVDGSLDPDGDYMPNYADPDFVPYADSNCDGINDFFDFDRDGVPDFLDLDSDNDGITDSREAGGTDANGDGIIDGFVDANADGLSDPLGPGLIVPDFDGDGLKNQRDRDSDGDGITDTREAAGADTNGDGIIDGFADVDGDGYSTNIDPTTNNLALTGGNASGNSPLTVPNTDLDSRINAYDIDSDNDGITDNVEAQPTVGYVAPATADTDADGISNAYDNDNGGTPVNPVNTDGADAVDYLDADSDNDNVPDTIEGNDAGSNGVPVPALPVTGDTDGDGLLNAYDLTNTFNSTISGLGGSGGNAPVQDTDADGLRDWRDTDDDNDCILTASIGATGENVNSNGSWADDFSQGGVTIPNYLFSSSSLTVANGNRCGTGTVSLSASSALSGTFAWFNISTGGSALQTNVGVTTSTFTTASISTTTTFYLEYTSGACTKPRIAVVANVTSAAATITVTNGSRCGTGSISLSASNPVAGIFRWYNVSSGGAALQTDAAVAVSSFTTPSLGVTTPFYVEFDNGSCISARTSVTATVLSNTPTVTNGIRCGSGSVNIVASNAVPVTFRWFDAPTGGTLLQTSPGVNTSTLTTPSLTASTTYYVEFIEGTCNSSRVAVTATINAALVNPTGTNGTTCGTGTVALAASHPSTGTFRWYSVASGGTSLQTNAAVTTSNFTTPSISASTTYYVEFENSGCISSRVAVAATVINSNLITPTPASRCGTGIVILSASSPIAGTFRWYSTVTGGVLLQTSPANVLNNTFTTPSIAANTTYFVTFEKTSASICAETTPRVAIVAAVGTAVTVTPTSGSVCAPGTVALSAATGAVLGTFRWYAAVNGGSPLQTSASGLTTNTFTTPFLTSTTDYYVEFTPNAGTCTTSPRTVVRANVIGTTSPGVTDGTRCGTGTVTLSANSLTTGQFQWFAAPTGGVALSSSGANVSAHAFTTPSITTTTTYYVQLVTTTPVCTSPRVAVVAYVLPAVVAPTAINGTRCGTGTVTIAASSSVTGIIRWYTAATGGTLLQTDFTTNLSTFVTPSIAATTTYYAEFSNNGYCTSGRTAVLATVNAGVAPAAPTTTAASRCGDGSVSLTATSGTSGIFRWWSALTGGTVLQTSLSSTSSTFVTPSLSANTTYYVEFDNGTCVSSSRASVVATINPIPASPVVTDNFRCGTGSVSLNATSFSVGTFRWYNVATGGTSLQTNAGVTSSIFSTSSISTTTDFYVEFDNGICISARVAVTANVYPVPTAPTGTGASRDCTGTLTLSASSSATGSFRWYDAAVGGTLLQTSLSTTSSSFVTPSISTSTNYFVEFDNGSCASTRTTVVATVNSEPAAAAGTDQTICSSAGSATMAANTPSFGSGSWSFVSGPVSGTIVAPTAPNSVISGLTTSGTYVYEWTITGTGPCVTSDQVSIFVNAPPTISSAGSNQTICSTGFATLAANTPASGSGTWSIASGPSTSTAQFNSLTNPNATFTPSGGGGNYFLVWTISNSPCTASTSSLTVAVTVQPVVPTVLSTTQPTCAVTSGTIVFTTQTGVDYGVDGVYQASATFSGLAAGVKTLSVRSTANNSCFANAASTVTINAVPTAPTVPTVSSTTQPTCAIPSGTIVFNTQVGVDYGVNGVYQASTTFSGLTSGVKTLSVRNTSDNTCTTAAAATVTINAVPTAPTAPTVSSTTQPTCAVPSGTIVFNTQVGVDYGVDGVYQVSATFAGLTSGIKTLSVRSTTDNTCVANAASTVTINAVPTAPTAPTVFSTTQPTCAVPSGTIVFNTQVGVEYGVDGVYQASATFSGLSSGVKTLSVRNTSDNTCTTSAASTVTINAVPTAPTAPTVFSTTQPTCAVPSGTIVFNTQVGVEYGVDGVYQVSTTFSGLTSGVKTLSVRNTSDNTCTTAAAATVTINAVPTAPTVPTVFSTTQPTCAVPSGTIVFTTQVGVDYGVNGVYQASATFAGLAPATYTLSVRSTSDNTCITSAASTVTINAVPTAPTAPTVFSMTQPTCAVPSGTIVFTTQVGVDYGVNGVYQASATFSTLAPATYNLSVRSTADNTCIASAASSVTINAVPNCPPVAVNDAGSTNEDAPVTITNIASNDTDVDGTVDVSTVDLDPATPGIQNTFTNAQGSWSVDALGNVTFIPVLNFNGTASITYTVNDNSGATSNIATLSILVAPVNDAPVLSNDVASANSGLPVSGNILGAGDSDPDGTALVVTTTPVSGPSNGTIVINSDGTYTYTPTAGFSGTDVVTIQVCDKGLPLPAMCTTETLTITVTNNPLQAVNDNGSTNEDTPVTLNVVTNDLGSVSASTVDLDPSTAGVQTTFTNAQGTWSVDALGNVTFTPLLNFNGTASIPYTVKDTNGNSSNTGTITIIVNPVNDAPVVVDQNIQTPEGKPVTGSILTGASDPEGTALTVNITPVQPPSNGTIVINPDGTYTYTPNLGFVGKETIVVEVCDTGLPLPGICRNETITIDVTPTSDVKIIVPEGFSPNGDGQNDTFVIKNLTGEKIYLEIYNRWGNIVFKDENYQNDWGGNANFGVVLGQGLPDGTYYYIVEIGNFKETRFMTIHR